MAVAASEFLATCEHVDDPAYRGATVLDILLMTRPPTSFDVQLRFARTGRSAKDAVRTTNALRGTNYPAEGVRSLPGQELDVRSPFFLFPRDSEITFLLGNLRTNEKWFDLATKGTPHLGGDRLARVAAVVNSALKKARRHPITILVLPELSVPRLWLRPLAERLASEGVSAVVGLEYERSGGKVFNHAVAVMATGRHGSAVALWKKGRPAREEDKLLSERLLALGDAPSAMPMLVRTDGGVFTVLICSELLDVELRSSLIGRIDILVVPAWNKDTATFDHTIQTVANDLHCYVVVANNGVYSDCRVFGPKRERHERDVARLICRTEDDTLSTTIHVQPLRTFQSMSLADREFPRSGQKPEFKAVPPAYVNKR